MNFADYKKSKYNSSSEIHEHLPVLEEYASKCNIVTEFGVRNANSTVAFLSGAKERVVSYDIAESDDANELLTMHLPVPWQFVIADTKVCPTIDPTDFLFIDTDHTYEQVKQELSNHASKVSKFIGFHDTEKYGVKSYCGIGINLAIYEFVNQSNKLWDISYYSDKCNGLLILEAGNKRNIQKLYDLLKIELIYDYFSVG